MKQQVRRLVAGAAVAAVVAGITARSAGELQAATATANVSVSASVAANCQINAGSVAFGTYDVLGANDTADLDATGSVEVRCTKGTAAQLGLSDGNFLSGGTRRMSNGSEFLTYNLYTSAAYATVWNSANRVGYTAASKGWTSLDIYGKVPSGQDVGVGSYADTVVATIEF